MQSRYFLGLRPLLSAPLSAVSIPLPAMFFCPCQPPTGATFPLLSLPTIAFRPGVAVGLVDLEPPGFTVLKPSVNRAAVQSDLLRRSLSPDAALRMFWPGGAGVEPLLVSPDKFAPFVRVAPAAAFTC